VRKWKLEVWMLKAGKRDHCGNENGIAMKKEE
jgi:hypothetical protein